MELNDYQAQAMTTCLPACENIPYMLFNLQGEVGELSSKIAKTIRKDMLDFTSSGNERNKAYFHCPETSSELSGSTMQEIRDAIKGELGDVLWQLSGVCSVLGFKLEDIAKSNLAKLASRKQRGVIDGNGDNR